MQAEGLRIEREASLGADPQDLLIYGWAMYQWATTASALQQAQRILERVLEIDPGSVRAKVGVGYALASNVANYWSTSARQDVVRAEQLLLEAVEQDPNNALGRGALGLLRRLQNRLDESRIELETAIALAPNYAPAHWMLGTTLVLLGQPDAAIVESEKGLRLTPPGAAVPVAYTIMSQGHLLLGHMDKAVELARKACTGNPRLYFTHMLLAAALGLNDELDEARAALTEALKIRQDLDSLARLRAYMTWGSPRYWALREKTINRGLRRAGMPDG